MLLGIPSGSRQNFTYPAITVYGSISQNLRLPHRFITARKNGGPSRRVPQPRTRNTRRLSHAYGLAIIRFRSPLLTESLLFSSPTGTEMFHFPASPPTALYIQTAATPHDWC
jgi:hypothetical protein